MSDQLKSYQEPTREEITACAHRIYEMDGRPDGKAVEHWLQAEAQLRAERKTQAGLLPMRTAKSEPAAGKRIAKARNTTWPAQPAPRQSIQHN